MIQQNLTIESAIVSLMLLTIVSGCASQASKGQHVRLSFNEVASERIVITNELVEVEDSGTTVQPLQTRLLHSEVCLIRGSTYETILPPQQIERNILLRKITYTESVITIYAPGYIIMTVYPLGWDGTDAVTSAKQHRAVMGWRRNKYNPMSAQNGLVVSPWFDAGGDAVLIPISLRKLKIDGMQISPSPFVEGFAPDSVCDIDALTFIDQTRSLLKVLQAHRPSELGVEHKTIWDTVQQEYRSLMAAGFENLLNAIPDTVVQYISKTPIGE